MKGKLWFRMARLRSKHSSMYLVKLVQKKLKKLALSISWGITLRSYLWAFAHINQIRCVARAGYTIAIRYESHLLPRHAPLQTCVHGNVVAKKWWMISDKFMTDGPISCENAYCLFEKSRPTADIGWLWLTLCFSEERILHISRYSMLNSAVFTKNCISLCHCELICLSSLIRAIGRAFIKGCFLSGVCCLHRLLTVCIPCVYSERILQSFFEYLRVEDEGGSWCYHCTLVRAAWKEFSEILFSNYLEYMHPIGLTWNAQKCICPLPSGCYSWPI